VPGVKQLSIRLLDMSTCPCCNLQLAVVATDVPEDGDGDGNGYRVGMGIWTGHRMPCKCRDARFPWEISIILISVAIAVALLGETDRCKRVCGSAESETELKYLYLANFRCTQRSTSQSLSLPASLPWSWGAGELGSLSSGLEFQVDSEDSRRRTGFWYWASHNRLMTCFG